MEFDDILESQNAHFLADRQILVGWKEERDKPVQIELRW